MLVRKLEKEGIQYEYSSLYEDDKLDPESYKKYGIKSTPVLITLDGENEADRLVSVDEIVEYLRNEQSTEV